MKEDCRSWKINLVIQSFLILYRRFIFPIPLFSYSLFCLGSFPQMFSFVGVQGYPSTVSADGFVALAELSWKTSRICCCSAILTYLILEGSQGCLPASGRCLALRGILYEACFWECFFRMQISDWSGNVCHHDDSSSWACLHQILTRVNRITHPERVLRHNWIRVRYHIYPG